MSTRRHQLKLVIFDCDGVIVDSEPVANRLVARALTQLGWPMTPADAEHYFLGMTLVDMASVIEARIGGPLTDDWKQTLRHDVVEAMKTEATAIPGAIEALRAVTALGLPWRIASNSSHEELAAKFARLGITALVAGRVHSHRDVARGKPAPDLFLAAAAAEGVDPQECLVIEDSLPGVRAAAAASMDCLGYAPSAQGPALRQAGALPFASMFEVPDLIRAALRQPA